MEPDKFKMALVPGRQRRGKQLGACCGFRRLSIERICNLNFSGRKRNFFVGGRPRSHWRRATPQVDKPLDLALYEIIRDSNVPEMLGKLL